MYDTHKKKHRIPLILFIFAIIAFIFIYLYVTYNSININRNSSLGPEYTSTKTSYQETSVSDVESNNVLVADVIENITSCVVGISKLKNNGTTIFNLDTTTSLGLGTGVIVSSTGYILTNQHVCR